MRSFQIFITALFFLIVNNKAHSQITLSHNVGNELLDNASIYACSNGGLRWSRVFKLENYGIAQGDNFVIDSGDMGVYSVSSWDTNIKFNIYSVDDNFPESFNEAILIGSSQAQRIYYFTGGSIIETLNFETPVIVPAGTENILVEVEQVKLDPNSSPVIIAAGTEQDDDVSWFRSNSAGCPPYNYNTTNELNYPNARFYITVTGIAQPATANIDDYKEALGIYIYPNPSTGVLNIEAEDNFISYEIVDMLGQVFIKDDFKSTQTVISIEDLSVGVYVINIKTIDGSFFTKRIIRR